MKHIYLLFLLASVSFLMAKAHAQQLVVDAGPDTVICLGAYYGDTITIGGQVAAQGGTPHLYL